MFFYSTFIFNFNKFLYLYRYNDILYVIYKFMQYEIMNIFTYKISKQFWVNICQITRKIIVRKKNTFCTFKTFLTDCNMIFIFFSWKKKYTNRALKILMEYTVLLLLTCYIWILYFNTTTVLSLTMHDIHNWKQPLTTGQIM